MTSDELVFRRYEPTDHPQVCFLFKQGIQSFYPALWRSTVQAPKVGLPILLTSTLVTTVTRILTKKLSVTLAAALVTTVLPLAAIWWKVSESFDWYIDFCLQKEDLSSPEKLQRVYGGNGVFIVALKGNEVVGMVGGEDKNEKEGRGSFELRRMSVDRRMQRNGIAKQLVQKLEDELGSHKKKIFLTCSSAQYAARQMYANSDFQCRKEFQFGSWFTKQGLSFFRLEKTY
jgi:predicted N-acetyltransferase YhbS